MRAALALISILIASCASDEQVTKSCSELFTVDAVTERCFAGDPGGEYVGDAACYLFSETRQYDGILITGFEWSEFYPNIESYAQADRENPVYWFRSTEGVFDDLEVNQAQCTHDCAFAVSFSGRETVCEYGYGHLGGYPKLVLGEGKGSISQLDITRQN